VRGSARTQGWTHGAGRGFTPAGLNMGVFFMELTGAMRAFAQAKLALAETASDVEIKAALGAALVDGRLDQATWASLQANKTPDARSVVGALIDERLNSFGTNLISQVRELVGAGAKGNGQQGGGTGGQGAGSGGAQGGSQAQQGQQGAQGGQQGGQGQQGQQGDFDAAVSRSVTVILEKAGFTIPANGQSDDGRVSPTQFLTRAAATGYLAQPHVRVKSAVERYNQSRSEARWGDKAKHQDLRGKRVTFPSEEGPGMGRPMDLPSVADKAIAGAWFRFALHSRGYSDLPPRYRMNDHDWELVKYALHELPWTGVIGGEEGTPIDGQKLAEVWHRGQTGLKALLDDSVSGGIYAAPQVVEDAIILQPLLYGELFPLVTVQNLARGRRITGPTMGTPTFTSGTPEGTPIPLFDTTNFIGSLDTTIFTSVGAMEIGMDLEEDSPANLGAAIISRYGEAAQQWLDRVIAVGDGVSEPKGIFNTAGVTTVPSSAPTGPLAIADAEGLMFGVNKAYRTSRGGRNVFISNEDLRQHRLLPALPPPGIDRQGGDGWQGTEPKKPPSYRSSDEIRGPDRARRRSLHHD
jgi:hypothetical protein